MCLSPQRVVPVGALGAGVIFQVVDLEHETEVLGEALLQHGAGVDRLGNNAHHRGVGGQHNAEPVSEERK